jgi:antitoxin (DNA-binding transcriptional repressor) of toxin-antitoxin stability system
MIATGIRELKTHLSRYLRQVAGGETILITDRGRVVAEVRPPGAAAEAADPADVKYHQLVAAGVIRPAMAPNDRSWTEWPGLGVPAGTAQSLIDADRDES